MYTGYGYTPSALNGGLYTCKVRAYGVGVTSPPEKSLF